MAYADEAVLPFYGLHQTVLLTVGHFVARWPILDLVNWAAIDSRSLAVCLGLYEFLVRRHKVPRFLFGMRPQAAQSSAQPSGMFSLGLWMHSNLSDCSWPDIRL